jgi:hypothetical protein
VTDGVFDEGLGFGSGDLSRGISIPFSNLIGAATTERSNELTEGFNSKLIYSPLDFLVDVELGSGWGPGVSIGKNDTASPPITIPKKKGLFAYQKPTKG